MCNIHAHHKTTYYKTLDSPLLYVFIAVLQIYDIQTGQKTLTLNDPALANNYKRNCATFNPTDDLVLNDGVLWDVRASRAIHKFDKFNMNISGVFHPNGLEVIINTEIVSSDLRHACQTHSLFLSSLDEDYCWCVNGQALVLCVCICSVLYCSCEP